MTVHWKYWKCSSDQWIGHCFISNYETVLNTISFLHTGEDPTEGSRDVTVLMILDLTQHSINSDYLASAVVILLIYSVIKLYYLDL